jgi:tetratricopeptide (TPR) repeat protein
MDNYFEQGLAHLDDGEYDEAIATLTKAVRLSLGDLAEILLFRGIAYRLKGDEVRALADFDASLEQDPYAAQVYCERGKLFLEQGKLKDALQDFNFALNVDAQFEDVRLQRALTYEAMGLYDEAELDLSTLIQQNPTLSQPYEVRGRVRAHKQCYDDAIADLERYLRMGGGREHDNHSETQAFLITLRVRRWFARLLRPRQSPKKT